MKEEPKGPYIYQPYGVFDNKNWESGKIYAIGGLELSVVTGITLEQAKKILDILTDPRNG